MNHRLLLILKSISRTAAFAAAMLISTVAWAQDAVPVEADDGRSYTLQYVMVVLLSAMAVAAACKPSFRHGPEES